MGGPTGGVIDGVFGGGVHCGLHGGGGLSTGTRGTGGLAGGCVGGWGGLDVQLLLSMYVVAPSSGTSCPCLLDKNHGSLSEKRDTTLHEGAWLRQSCSTRLIVSIFTAITEPCHLKFSIRSKHNVTCSLGMSGGSGGLVGGLVGGRAGLGGSASTSVSTKRTFTTSMFVSPDSCRTLFLKEIWPTTFFTISAEFACTPQVTSTCAVVGTVSFLPRLTSSV